MKFRKRPIIIEAFKWTGDQKMIDYPEWAIQAIQDGTIVIPSLYVSMRVHGRTVMEINTLEGKMIADNGDYIIRGINGEIYPCKPDIFEKTYDKLEVDSQFNRNERERLDKTRRSEYTETSLKREITRLTNRIKRLNGRLEYEIEKNLQHSLVTEKAIIFAKERLSILKKVTPKEQKL